MTVNVSKPALNVREQLAELDKPTGIAGEAMLRAETPQEQFNLIGAGRRNLIINGDFQVSQRGDYSSATAITNGSYYLDRFKLGLGTASTGTVQHTTETLPNNKTVKSLKIVSTATASSGYLAIRHVFEDFRLLSNQTITVSAWIKTNIAGYTFRHDSTTNFGDTFPATGNWEYVTATYTMPTITAAGSGANQTTLAIINYTGSNGTGQNNGDYFQIAQVQLELGKVATPFEHRSYGEELALCQRFFWQISGNASDQTTFGNGYSEDTDSAQVTLFFPVEMRDAPSTTISNNDVGESSVQIVGVGVAHNASLNSILDPSRLSVRLRFNADSGTPFTAGHAIVGRLTNSTSAYIYVDAEL